jgi:galactokinase
VPPERARAFAPGRVNLIGEHTDYNGGLALPFAISRGVVVDAAASDDRRVRAYAVDLDQEDEFELSDRERVDGWRAFVRGAVAELSDNGAPLRGASLRIGGDLPQGAGLSSSAALEVSLCIALLGLTDLHVAAPELLPSQRAAQDGEPGRVELARLDIARLCSRIENDWVGAETGLLDQIASLFGRADAALLIDFATLAIEPVPLHLDRWKLVVLDSGERHTHSGSGYNERRSECARAAELLGVRALSEADAAAAEQLPEPLRRRARHVLGENERVREAVAALTVENLPQLGSLLDASHASLRDDFEISTPAVEASVARLRDAGAAGARIMGGGFGGCVLGLFAPDAPPPEQALEVRPGAGAHLLES